MEAKNLKRFGDAGDEICNFSSSPSKQQRLLYSMDQKKIAEHAKSPGQQEFAIRVTSAAGSGKTTTLKLVAEVLNILGHSEIYYVTFNRTATTQLGISYVTSETVHSCAFHALDVMADHALLLKSETDLEDRIKSVCGENIFLFLLDMPMKTQFDRQSKKRAEKIVRIYILKTLIQFLQSSRNEKEGFDPKQKYPGNVYYPAIKWHKGKGDTLPKGVPTAASEKDELEVTKFYVENAKLIWDLMIRQNNGGPPLIMTFDSVLKRAQLQNVKISCTALLVDESQDLNACQIAWICTQV